MATVIAVDLPVLTQVPPGGKVRFVETTLAEAEAWRIGEAKNFGMFASAVKERFVRKDSHVD